MKRSFQNSNASSDHWEENEEGLSRPHSYISDGGSYYGRRISEARNRLSMKTSRSTLLKPMHGLLAPRNSPLKSDQSSLSERNSTTQGLLHDNSSQSVSSISSHSSCGSTRSSPSTRSKYTASLGFASSESSTSSLMSISPDSSVMTPGATPCGPSPSFNIQCDSPLSPGFDTFVSHVGAFAEYDHQKSYPKASDLQSTPLFGGAYPMPHVHGNDQYSQTLQQPNSVQSTALLSRAYTSILNSTPFCFDPNIQVSWSSPGMQSLGNIPSQGYSELIQGFQCLDSEPNKIEVYDPIVLPRSTKRQLPRVPEARSCQSYVSQREDPKRMQITMLKAEFEEPVAIPVVADFKNATTQSSTEIRSVESPDPKPLASNCDQLSVSSKSSPVTATKGRIQDWRLNIQDASSETRSDDSRSMSALVFAEEDLEDRVSWMFGNDPSFSQALICNLKDKVDFILPLFNVDEDQDLFDSPFVNTPPAYERGSSQGTSSNSTISSGSKSSNASTSATPATTADVGKEEKPTEDEDKSSKNRQPSIKRRISGNSQASGGRERRRLRCHFHAKCPASHNKRTCTQSGWLSIHNLKGHYDAHHTVIRCNRCFEEFAKKPEKNIHQRSCTANDTSPALEVIDCDKADEIEEMIGSFRTWKLEDEQDEQMKTWVMKYKLELNNKTKDDAHDSRELGKWYKYWGILYPTHQTVVPNPFQISSASPGDLKLERWLEVFESMVETKLSQNQVPPPDPRRQIDYYKNIIRDVYNLIQPNSSSRTIPSPQVRNTPDVHSLSTRADSLTQASPKSKGSPEVKQDTTTGQKILTENNDQDLASQKSQSSGPEPPVNCSPPPNTIAEVVPTEQQSATKPSVTAELNVAITATGMTGTQNAWTKVLDPDRETFSCHFCGGSGFVYFDIEIQRCAFCNYL